MPLSWKSDTDWDATTGSGVVHENTSGTDFTNAHKVLQGYSVENPISPSISSYWPLHEDSGSVANDVIGTNDATIFGTTPTTGLLNTTALQFNGAGDYVEIPNGATAPQMVTLLGWIYPTAIDTVVHNTIFDSGDWNYRLIISDTKELVISAYDGTSSYWINYSAHEVPLDKWQQVGFRIDLQNNVADLIYNGQQVASNVADAISRSGTSTLGKIQWDAAEYFSGRISTVQVFNGLLTDAEIQEWYEIVTEPSSITTAAKIA